MATLNRDWQSSARVLHILRASVQSESLLRLFPSEDFGRSVGKSSESRAVWVPLCVCALVSESVCMKM